jgi:hypothetical protein
LNPTLQVIQSDTGCKPSTLWKHAVRADPELKLGKEDLRPVLSEANKLERLDYCKKMLKWKPPKLDLIVLLDEASIQMKIMPQHVIYKRGQRPVSKDPRIKNKRLTSQRLSNVLVINGLLGLVKLIFTSSTTGSEKAGAYQVSNIFYLFWDNLVIYSIV